MKTIPGLFGAVALTLLIELTSTPARAAGFSEEQLVVDKARMTLEAFAADAGLKEALRDWSKVAKALFVVPQFLRGAFVFGGAGGSGVLMVREEGSGNWSQPVFYTIGSASFGLQIGGDVSEIVMVVRNQKGLEEFYRNDFKLGADASLAAGPVGQGASVKGIAGDILAYARKKGAFAGIAVEGAVIAVSNDANQAYYGRAVRPTDIVLKGSVSNPRSLDLRNTAAKLMK